MIKKTEVYVSNIDELFLKISHYTNMSPLHNPTLETPNIILDDKYGYEIIKEGCKANDYKHNYAYFYALAQDGLIDTLDYKKLSCFLELEHLDEEKLNQLYFLSTVALSYDLNAGQIILRFCAKNNSFLAQLKIVNLHLISDCNNFDDAIMCADALAKKGYLNPMYDLGKKYEQDEFLAKYIMTKAKSYGSEQANIWLKNHGE